MAEIGIRTGGVDEKIVDGVVSTNFKTLAEAAAAAQAKLYESNAQSFAAGVQNQTAAQNMALQNAVASQNRITSIAEAALAKFIDNLSSVDPIEAVSTARLFKGDADSSIASLLAQQSAGAIGIKQAQSVDGSLASQLASLSASIASQGTQLGAVVALVQQLMKGAQSTPPETATGK
jgi:hypothetical protein